jgi:DNA polymerase I-like protein with 3'-5' exonuclease and polymerase domains
MSRYMILDLETQTHSTYKRKANPFDDRNWIVMRGWKFQGDSRASMEHFPSRETVREIHIPDDVDVLVAHNAKFELLYERVFSNDTLQAFFQRGGRIHCTQYAEYLLRGQQQKYQMVALDAIVESYGGRKKIDGIKELWAAGVMTSEIDPELLEDYLIGTEAEGRNSGDIGNTELVYLGQIAEAEAVGLTEGMKLRMDGLCATAEMEFNGIKIDVVRAKADLAKRTAELAEVRAELQQYIADIPEEVGFNWGSGVHLSALIFGGTIRYEKQDTYLDGATGELARLKATAKWPLFDGVPRDPAECTPDDAGNLLWHSGPSGGVRQDIFQSGKQIGQGKFKNVTVPGELKVKYQDFFYTLPGYTKPDPEWKTKLTDGRGNAVYGTGSDVIDRISKRDIPFLKAMGKFGALNKEIGTYYVRDDGKGNLSGMLTCVDRNNHIVHHKLNHTSTVTTRLSSSDPNFQNIPRGDKSDVKAMMTSRFPDGVVGELDYSQLEVVVQGLLSGDVNLVSDLQDRIDFHCKRVAAKYGCTYEEAIVWCKDEAYAEYPLWKKRRTGVKEFSFQRAYGAGAAAIADATGLDIETVKELIEAEDRMYPGVGRFNAKVEKEVNATAEPFRDPERGYRVFRRGNWQAPTGTIYSWRSWDAPAFMRQQGITESFSPPELKNYPVQGTGGEIVQIVLGYLWRWFTKTGNFGGKALLVNTVHDCVWVDMHPDVVHTVIPGMKRIMEAVPAMLKKHFNIECPVPFPVEAEVGPNMLDLKHYAPAA